MSLLVRCSGLVKSFSGVKALREVDFDVQAGEVHALAGENGAGKSTLTHVLAGVHQPDSGTIEIDGQAVSISDEQAAQRLGVSIVYQERSLFDLLTVAENVFVNRPPVDRWGLIDRREMRRSARELLEEVELQVNPDARAGSLPPAQQQMVEIAKALSLRSRIFILDEPTSAITIAETKTLFGVIRRLRARGVGIIYISHRVEEIFSIADRVTVLKDGTSRGTWYVKDITSEELVNRMVGRAVVHNHVPREVNRNRVPALQVSGLSDAYLNNITFDAYGGEILGFAGLAGAGRTETAMAIFGVRHVLKGEIRVDRKLVRIRKPKEAMDAGVAYVTEDRRELGMFLRMTIGANIAAADLHRFGDWVLNPALIAGTAREYIQRLRIAATGPEAISGELSGGNQQKVLLARWLLRKPRILIADEPTRGIDVGAKAEIYDVLRSLAKTGTAVIIISSDLPEIIAISDRVIVMREGAITANLTRGEISEEAIMRHAALSEAGISAR
jgi:ABC-type sugar transport system ATPase subunit